MLDWLLGAGLAAYGGIAGGLYLGQRRLLYRPHGSRPVLGDLAALGTYEVELVTAEGLKLFSWYRPPRPGRPVIAYFHGNGGNIGFRGDRLRYFATHDYGVMFAEYRGYGGNPGEPCESGLFRDGEAALDYLADNGIANDRVVLWGDSLGSGVAVYLAATRVVGALVLEAPFTSVAACAQRHYPFVPAVFLVHDRFDSLSRIAAVRAPLLILHGERDRVVPVRHGRRLLAAANSPKEGWFSPHASHENLGRFGALDVAVEFIERRLCWTVREPVAEDVDFD